MKNRTAIICLFLAALVCRAAAGDALPKFDELYQALSTNLMGATPEELNRAAVQGLLNQLAPKVQLESATAGAQSAASNFTPLAQTRVFEQSIAYFRVASVNGKLPDAFRDAYRTVNATNAGKIKGIVLDLRFADGTDYQAAAKTADCFMNSDQPLIDWRQGSARSTKKTDAILVPVAILINSQTVGAAEALAAALREAGAGLIIGNTTSGQASIFKEIPLSNGDKLRVAVAGIVVGDGKAQPTASRRTLQLTQVCRTKRHISKTPTRTFIPRNWPKPQSALGDASRPGPVSTKRNWSANTRPVKTPRTTPSMPARYWRNPLRPLWPIRHLRAPSICSRAWPSWNQAGPVDWRSKP